MYLHLHSVFYDLLVDRDTLNISLVVTSLNEPTHQLHIKRAGGVQETRTEISEMGGL